MPFPIKICVICEDEFELRPNKPGYANRCPACSEPDSSAEDKQQMDKDERRSMAENNEARRNAIRNLLYRKDA